MEKIFDQDGWLFRFLGRILDLILLNILFILTSIPIVTIGTSVCAMYSVLLKAVRNEESYIFRSYIRAWKKNLKRGILLGILSFCIMGILLINIFYAAGMMGEYGEIWVFICGVFLVIFSLPLRYVFPLQARYDNTFSEIVRNAFVLSIKYLLSTIQLIIIQLLPAVITVCVILFATEKLVWICTAVTFIGFSGMMFLSSFVYRRIFDEIELLKEENKKSY